MKVYFDRNIFDDIKKLKDVHESATDIAVLRSAVDEGRLTVLLSTTVLEETLPALNLSYHLLKQELEVIFSLVQKRRMIKSPAVLLREAVQSYAFARKPPEMLTRTPPVLENFLTKGKAATRLKEFLEATVAQNTEFAEGFDEIFEKVRQLGEEQNIGRPDFKELWNDTALGRAEDLAKQHHVYDRCVERGIEGLLEVKAIRLYVIYYVAWVFSKWFGEQGIPGKVKPSERGDFFHAVQAAAADIFVTRDGRLARWLKQISVVDLDIINLKQLIERLS